MDITEKIKESITGKYWSIKKIMSKQADYNIIIGERSNGKTYGTLKYMLENYCTGKGKGVYMRRWGEDIRPKRAGRTFEPFVLNGTVEKLTGGKFNRIAYKNSCWYLGVFDENLQKIVTEENPFCYALAINDMEHTKSVSFPEVTTIVFDEFLTRGAYLVDEFMLFMNSLSTIIRDRDGVKIFMLGNTVNQYCPYFEELGLTHIQHQKQGTIDVYDYGDSELKVAVEYCGNSIIPKPSNKYFAFNNPRLQMVKKGTWEIGIYPHLPYKYNASDVMGVFFIDFDGNVVQGDMIQTKEDLFIYIHKKTTPIKDETKDLIFRLESTTRHNICSNLYKPSNKACSVILQLFNLNHVFYQTNQIGEIVHNYILECKKF